MSKRTILRFLLALPVLLGVAFGLHAQTEDGEVIFSGERGAHVEYVAPAEWSAHKTAQDTVVLTLPFRDHFFLRELDPRAPQIHPDSTLWLSRKTVYISRNGSVHAPDFGTAVLDGRAQGWGHHPAKIPVNGLADTLVSQYIDLSAIKPEDSLFLSFYYQCGGLLERPEKDDTLSVWLRKKDSTFVQVWKTYGALDTATFRRGLLPITDTAYLHDRFQIRFQNRATLTGPYDCWHLDAVLLDTGRTSADTSVADVGIVGPAQNGLYPHTATPRRQFRQLATEYVYVHNFDTTAQAANLRFLAHDPGNDVILIYLEDRPLAALPALRDTAIEFGGRDPAPYIYNANSRILTDLTLGGTDAYVGNDTLRVVYPVDSLLAYDDGEAESWYGVVNAAKGFGQKFYLNAPDQIQALWVSFSPREAHTDTLLTFTVFFGKWKNGVLKQYFSTETDTVKFGDAPNTYLRFPFVDLDPDTARVADSIFVGVRQNEYIPLGVGYDKTYNGPNRVYYQYETEWRLSAGAGALAIRPEFVNPFDPAARPRLPQAADVVLYPNPASQAVAVRAPDDAVQLTLVLRDVVGREVWRVTQAAAAPTYFYPDVPPGVFLFELDVKQADGRALRRTGKLIYR